MLSYQHAYHAGNLADVHKHALLCWMLDYLTRKDKPLSYLETHAGRGLYFLDSAEALKTGESGAGIGHVAQNGLLAADHPYCVRIAEARARYGAAAYPGSPLLAALSLRPGDRITLTELHPQEHATLSRVMAEYGASCHRRDGAEMALSLTPPDPRRGLILIDPSYELKDDYKTIPALVRNINRRWNVGVIMLWYPLLAKPAHLGMLGALAHALPEAMRHEIRFGPAREGHRMIGSGVLVVNPPTGLSVEAKRLSDTLAGM